MDGGAPAAAFTRTEQISSAQSSCGQWVQGKTLEPSLKNLITNLDQMSIKFPSGHDDQTPKFC
jgi:hypothetical protein